MGFQKKTEGGKMGEGRREGGKKGEKEETEREREREYLIEIFLRQ